MIQHLTPRDIKEAIQKGHDFEFGNVQTYRKGEPVPHPDDLARSQNIFRLLIAGYTGVSFWTDRHNAVGNTTVFGPEDANSISEYINKFDLVYLFHPDTSEAEIETHVTELCDQAVTCVSERAGRNAAGRRASKYQRISAVTRFEYGVNLNEFGFIDSSAIPKVFTSPDSLPTGDGARRFLSTLRKQLEKPSNQIRLPVEDRIRLVAEWDASARGLRAFGRETIAPRRRARKSASVPSPSTEDVAPLRRTRRKAS